MPYTDDYVMSLPKGPIDAIFKVLDDLFKNHLVGPMGISEFFDARDLIIALSGYYHYPLTADVDINDFEILKSTLEHVRDVFNALARQKTIEDRRKRYETLLGSSFYYEFSDADTSRIQHLVNELREIITSNDELDQDYKRRLLLQLEGLQREIHKRVSDLTRFYGLIGDAGVLLGKFGKDAKPFVDRIREIVQIAWRSQANAEQLPTSAEPALLTTERDTPSD